MIPVTQRTAQQSETLLNWSCPFDVKWQQLSTEIKNNLPKKAKNSQQTVFVSTEGGKGVRPAIYNVQGSEFYERTYVLNRGNPNLKIEAATEGFSKILMQHPDNESHWIEQPAADSKSSFRRMSLASWITDAQHGSGSLLARVIVNRLWQYHFKTGLVTTLNDLGLKASVDKVTIHDLHATILHQLGVNHEQLSYSINGLDVKLTGVEGATVID